MQNSRCSVENSRSGGSDGRLLWRDVEVAFETAKQLTGAKGLPSLERVYEALVSLHRDGTKITVEAVATRCDGSPTAGSIRNNKRLIDVVRIAMGVQVVSTKPSNGQPVEKRFLDEISDPDLRAELEGLLSHRRTLLVQDAQMRQLIRRLRAITFLSEELTTWDCEKLEDLEKKVASAQQPDGLAFDAEEIAACNSMLKRDLGAIGLSVDEPSGEVVDKVGRTRMPRGVASALMKVASSKPLA